MTDNAPEQPSNLPVTATPAEKKSQRPTGMLALWMVVVMAISAIAVIAIWHNVRGTEPLKVNVSQSVDWQVEVEKLAEKTNSLVSRIGAVESRLDRLEQAPNAPAVPVMPAAQLHQDNDEDVAVLKSELASLSATVANLQQQLKQTGDSTSTVQFKADSALASAVAMSINSGKSFKHEIETLRQIAGDNQSLKDSIAQIEPFAAQGVPTQTQLAESFAAKAPAARLAVRKAAAEHWYDRVLIALQSLVTIRSTHLASGSTDDPFDAITSDLNNGALSAALEKFHTLPNIAQNNLRDWQRDAEARQKTDEVLSAIMAQLNHKPESK